MSDLEKQQSQQLQPKLIKEDYSVLHEMTMAEIDRLQNRVVALKALLQRLDEEKDARRGAA
jgi:hypothetical protein